MNFEKLILTLLRDDCFASFFIAKRDKNLECGRDAVAILIQEKNKPKKIFFFKFFLNKNHKNFKRSYLKSFGTSLINLFRARGIDK